VCPKILHCILLSGFLVGFCKLILREFYEVRLTNLTKKNVKKHFLDAKKHYDKNPLKELYYSEYFYDFYEIFDFKRFKIKTLQSFILGFHSQNT